MRDRGAPLSCARPDERLTVGRVTLCTQEKELPRAVRAADLSRRMVAIPAARDAADRCGARSRRRGLPSDDPQLAVPDRAFRLGHGAARVAERLLPSAGRSLRRSDGVAGRWPSSPLPPRRADLWGRRRGAAGRSRDRPSRRLTTRRRRYAQYPGCRSRSRPPARNAAIVSKAESRGVCNRSSAAGSCRPARPAPRAALNHAARIAASASSCGDRACAA